LKILTIINRNIKSGEIYDSSVDIQKVCDLSKIDLVIVIIITDSNKLILNYRIENFMKLVRNPIKLGTVLGMVDLMNIYINARYAMKNTTEYEINNIIFGKFFMDSKGYI
jgi:hypothetical protein